jgi:hypothetical protein
MKKIAIVGLVIVLAMSGPAFSQNKKGNLFLGSYIGGTGLSFSTTDYSTAGSPGISTYKGSGFNIGVGPMIGYYFTDTIVGGASLDLYFTSSKSDSSISTSTATATDKASYIGTDIGPFLRIYFGDNNGKGMPFVQFDAGIFFYPLYTETYTPSSGSAYTYKLDSYSSWNVGVKLGYEHYINPFIGIEYYVGYEYSHSKQTYTYDYVTGTDYTYSSNGSNNGINFGVGLQIHLGGGR